MADRNGVEFTVWRVPDLSTPPPPPPPWVRRGAPAAGPGPPPACPTPPPTPPPPAPDPRPQDDVANPVDRRGDDLERDLQAGPVLHLDAGHEEEVRQLEHVGEHDQRHHRVRAVEARRGEQIEEERRHHRQPDRGD